MKPLTPEEYSDIIERLILTLSPLTHEERDRVLTRLIEARGHWFTGRIAVTKALKGVR